MNAWAPGVTGDVRRKVTNSVIPSPVAAGVPKSVTFVPESSHAPVSAAETRGT